MVVRHSLGLLCLAALLALLGLATGSAGEDGVLEGASVGFYFVAFVLAVVALWRLYRSLDSE
jgi:hypothetical protein